MQSICTSDAMKNRSTSYLVFIGIVDDWAAAAANSRSAAVTSLADSLAEDERRITSGVRPAEQLG